MTLTIFGTFPFPASYSASPRAHAGRPIRQNRVLSAIFGSHVRRSRTDSLLGACKYGFEEGSFKEEGEEPSKKEHLEGSTSIHKPKMLRHVLLWTDFKGITAMTIARRTLFERVIAVDVVTRYRLELWLPRETYPPILMLADLGARLMAHGTHRRPRCYDLQRQVQKVTSSFNREKAMLGGSLKLIKHNIKYKEHPDINADLFDRERRDMLLFSYEPAHLTLKGAEAEIVRGSRTEARLLIEPS
ncbi:hypothetical protein EVAR_68838_1 [Eumeta japonica]|uniref:Uncharacterized protein n=1 Tax=Eumeta variegata TaxID=151549 RepID=A0A4C2A7C9_EUMVA|nr:hypothetical protein EVAR_68838_1 [Eumeta japonica]